LEVGPERDVELALVAEAERVGIEPRAPDRDQPIRRPAAEQVGAARQPRREADLEAGVADARLRTIGGGRVEQIDLPLFGAIEVVDRDLLAVAERVRRGERREI